MPSITKRIAADIERVMADPSVLFLTGKVRETQNAKKRRIIITRVDGKLSMSKAPERTAPGPRAGVLFDRRERFKFTLYAESEATVDQLLDNLVNCAWKLYAPNVFEDESEFSWKNEDAERGGAQMSRQPCVVIIISFGLMCSGITKLTTEVDTTEFDFDIEE